jgi:YebC/PmpR family DNA-binding regulatory protein
MSGHSKWASIKHKKAATDTRRGKLFTKLIKELTVAARTGGGNVDTNPRLRLAIQRAKDANMPAGNIDRAIKKGTGELPGVNYEQITYEGYGPKGVAIMLDALTDNKNRTTSEVRNIFAKKGGNMAGGGSVGWMFEKKGYFLVKKKVISEDKLMSIVLEAGAEDLTDEGDSFAVKTQPQDFEKVKLALDAAGIDTKAGELTMIPKSTIKITDKSEADAVLTLVESLEEHDDVQNVYSNFDIPDELIKEEEDE